MDDSVNEILSELFSSKIRAAVLEQMLPRPHVGYSLTDLSRLLELPISSLQHECYKLERIGVLKARRDGNSRRYRVDPTCPVLKELTALIVVALGPQEALRATMENVVGLDAAFLAATTPLTSEAQAAGPVPLVLIGEISLEEIDAAQERVTKLLGLAPGKIEAVFYRSGDWRSRLHQQSQYAMWLVSGPRTDLHGDVLNP
jgi:DNA-binding transcriptional ArsR family regulator